MTTELKPKRKKTKRKAKPRGFWNKAVEQVDWTEHSAEELAELFDSKIENIRLQAHLRDIKLQTSWRNWDELIKTIDWSKYSQAEAARHFGVSREMIRQVVNKYNLSCAPRTDWKQLIKESGVDWRQHTPSQLADIYQAHLSTIYSIADHYGMEMKSHRIDWPTRFDELNWANHTRVELAEHYQVRVQTIWDVAKRYGRKYKGMRPAE